MVVVTVHHQADRILVCHRGIKNIFEGATFLTIVTFAGEFVIGRVIKAMNANWHPSCFRCEECSTELADAGFIKHAGRALCHACNARIKADGLQNYMCHKCQ